MSAPLSSLCKGSTKEIITNYCTRWTGAAVLKIKFYKQVDEAAWIVRVMKQLWDLT